MSKVSAEGRCDERFTGVRDVFLENFSKRGEVGAALCISIDGMPVVDLWGGHSDAARSRPWRPDTLVAVASATKALTTICVHRLVERGLVDLDQPVARYWPEFAQQDKGGIPVRWLLSHRAGLPAIRRDLPADTLYDWNAMTAALAAETPWWTPGTQHGYHATTFGFLLGEIVRRVAGTTIGRMAAAELSGPLGADFFIGVPEADHARCAEVLPEPPLAPGEENVFTIADRDPYSLPGRVFLNPPRDPQGMSSARWRSGEIPASNGHASARGLARLYAPLALGGSAEGVRLLAPESIARATVEQSFGTDAVLGAATRFGLGFMLRLPEPGVGILPVVKSAGAFGHTGRGGSIGFADPERRVAFGYVMNQFVAGAAKRADRRWPLLAKAFYESLG